MNYAINILDLPQVVFFERNRATRDNNRGTSREPTDQRKGKIILERAFRKSINIYAGLLRHFKFTAIKESKSKL